MEQTEIEQLTAERTALADEKRQLAEKLSALGLSGNRRYSQKGSVPESVWNQRTEWATRYAQIESRLVELKRILHDADTYKNEDYFKDIIKEALGDEYVRRVKNECKRRKNGESPIKVSPRIPAPVIKTYRTDLIKVYETLIESRKALNKWITDNEPAINKADYLKSISPLNKSLPPIPDLEKELKAIKITKL